MHLVYAALQGTAGGGLSLGNCELAGTRAGTQLLGITWRFDRLQQLTSVGCSSQEVRALKADHQERCLTSCVARRRRLYDSRLRSWLEWLPAGKYTSCRMARPMWVLGVVRASSSACWAMTTLHVTHPGHSVAETAAQQQAHIPGQPASSAAHRLMGICLQMSFSQGSGRPTMLHLVG